MQPSVNRSGQTYVSEAMKMAESCKSKSGLKGHRLRSQCQQGLYIVESLLKSILSLMIYTHKDQTRGLHSKDGASYPVPWFESWLETRELFNQRGKMVPAKKAYHQIFIPENDFSG